VLFKSLDKLIRNALMLIIVMIFTGLTLFGYVKFLVETVSDPVFRFVKFVK
jgi:hypothetical protein